MDSRINLVVPFDAKKVRNGLSHPEQLLPKEDKKSAEGIYLGMQNRYKQYINREKKREKEEVKNMQAMNKMFEEVE